MNLLRRCRAYMPKGEYTLTSALPGCEWLLAYMHVQQASEHIDLFNVMCFDFAGPWSSTSGHHSQLYSPEPPAAGAPTSCFNIIQYLRHQKVPAAKILLGIPTYGRSFLGATAIGESYSGAGGHQGAIEYKDLPEPGSDEDVDRYAGAAYSVGGNGGFVTFDNPFTVIMKATFVRKNNLAGLFYWDGTGDVDGPRSLILAGYHSLHE